MKNLLSTFIFSVIIFFVSTNNYAQTPKIISLCIKGDYEKVEQLIEKGCIIDHVDAERRTALSYAAENGYLKIVELLLEKGAKSYNIPDKKNETPFDKAKNNNHTEITAIFAELQNYDNAKKADEMGGYEFYLSQHSSSKHATEIKDSLNSKYHFSVECKTDLDSILYRWFKEKAFQICNNFDSISIFKAYSEFLTILNLADSKIQRPNRINGETFMDSIAVSIESQLAKITGYVKVLYTNLIKNKDGSPYAAISNYFLEVEAPDYHALVYSNTPKMNNFPRLSIFKRNNDIFYCGDGIRFKNSGLKLSLKVENCRCADNASDFIYWNKISSTTH